MRVVLFVSSVIRSYGLRLPGFSKISTNRVNPSLTYLFTLTTSRNKGKVYWRILRSLKNAREDYPTAS